MKLKLSVVNSTGGNWADVTEHGSLKSNLSKTDKLFFSAKNIESDSRVVLFVQEGDDAPKMIACSARLSKNIRKALTGGAKKSDVMKALLPLEIVENEQGHFLVPKGQQGETFSVDSLVKGEPVSLEDLIG